MINSKPKVMEKGNKVYFKAEKNPYTVRACNERYAVCTKPFNLQHTVLYTIIDFEENVRGTENLVFCMGFETDKGCFDAIGRLQSGESEISYRNRIPLDIIEITEN